MTFSQKKSVIKVATVQESLVKVVAGVLNICSNVQTRTRRVNFQKGCRINGQRVTNVDHALQNNKLQNIFLSVSTCHINI